MKSQSERVLDYMKENGSISVLDEFLGIIGLPSIIYDLRKAGYQIGCARRFYRIERIVKDANPDHIKEYILSRLGTIFPCVSKHARIFRNSRNSPMFLFCFAIASESPKAQGLALRMADYILKNK